MHISNFRLHTSNKKVINKTIWGRKLHTSPSTMNKFDWNDLNR